MQVQRHYRGFTCWKDTRGVYRAVRYGVSVCAQDPFQLYHVIDHHIESKEWYETVPR